MHSTLTKEIAYKEIQNFFFENPKPMVIFGTGTSCALDSEFGMQALREHLIENVHINDDLFAQDEWKRVEDALDGGNDLESAMNAVSSENLIKTIVNISAAFIGAKNRQHSVPLLTGKKVWPAQPLFKRLVDHLPETDKCLHVATTNYDLLAEYAFTEAEIPFITGFSGGLVRRFDWERSDRMVIHSTSVFERKKLHYRRTTEKYIRLYKIHGSLNVFDFDGKIVECDEWINSVPNTGNISRIMITPGIKKVSEINDRRQELLHEFDHSVKKHNAFLFLGFGFNDNHIINKTIRQKFTHQGAHGVIITKESNERIDSILTESENLWLVCKDPSSDGTIISNCRYSENCLLPDRKLWMFDTFSSEIFGV